MKIRGLFCLSILLAGTLPVLGQMPATAPRPHSLSVSVEPTHTGGASQVHDGSRDVRERLTNTLNQTRVEVQSHQTQVTKASEGIQITVRNSGLVPDSAQVEWYFVCAPARPDPRKPFGAQQSIFDQGAKSVSVAPGGMDVIQAESAEVTEKIKRHQQAHFGKHGKIHVEKDMSGGKVVGSVLSGWMVRLVSEGRVIDARASKDQLEEIARDDSKFNVLKGQ